jgi:amino-acid N-acetyltransferase
MHTHFALLAADDSAHRLLETCGLPHADLDTPAVRLFGLYFDDELAAMVGIEACDQTCSQTAKAGLLRSLAVAPPHRGTGLGAVMTAHAERRADEFGLDELYLLTTGAAGFFRRLGYRVADRTEAPEAILATAQFAGLCPASAVMLTKRVGV